MANQTNLNLSGEIVEISQGKNLGGKPKRVLTDDEKKAALLYVQTTGLWRMRLSKYLKMDPDTLARILTEDTGFSEQLEAANEEFIGDTIRLSQRKDPSFILKTKAKEEFKEDPLEIKITPEEKIKDLIGAIRSNRQTENERPATVQGPSPSDVQEPGGQPVSTDGGAS